MLCLCNYILTQSKGSSSIFPLHRFYQPSLPWHKGDNRPEHVWIFPSGCLPWAAAVGLWQLVQLGTMEHLQTLVSPPSGRKWLVGERQLKKLLLTCARWIQSWNSSAGPFSQKSKRFCTFLWSSGLFRSLQFSGMCCVTTHRPLVLRSTLKCKFSFLLDQVFPLQNLEIDGTTDQTMFLLGKQVRIETETFPIFHSVVKFSGLKHFTTFLFLQNGSSQTTSSTIKLYSAKEKNQKSSFALTCQLLDSENRI